MIKRLAVRRQRSAAVRRCRRDGPQGPLPDPYRAGHLGHGRPSISPRPASRLEGGSRCENTAPAAPLAALVFNGVLRETQPPASEDLPEPRRHRCAVRAAHGDRRREPVGQAQPDGLGQVGCWDMAKDSDDSASEAARQLDTPWGGGLVVARGRSAPHAREPEPGAPVESRGAASWDWATHGTPQRVFSQTAIRMRTSRS